MTTVRRMTEYVPVTREEFRRRFFERFYDPAFDEVQAELEKVFERAWDGYLQYRKSPRTEPAGAEFSDPAFKLPVEWLHTRNTIREAGHRHKDPASPSRILVVSGATRSPRPSSWWKMRRRASPTWCGPSAQASIERRTRGCAARGRSECITLKAPFLKGTMAAGELRPRGE